MTRSEFAELRWLLHNRINQQKYDRLVERVQAGCQGKQAFHSQPDAQRAMHREETRRTCAPYRCPHCGSWHVGRRLKA